MATRNIIPDAAPVPVRNRAAGLPHSPQTTSYTAPARTVAPVTKDAFGVTSAAGDYTPPGGGGDLYGGFGVDGGLGVDGQLPTMGAEEDWLAGDAAFQAQLAALIRASQDYDSDVTAQQTRYGTDYNDALKGLGWVQDDPATVDVNEGKWNFKDLNTAAGRSFQNQQNDFAGRGLLQSSLYGTANDNLTRSLNDQLGGINSAKQTFFDDLSRQQGAFKNENTLGQQQARAEALARRAASII